MAFLPPPATFLRPSVHSVRTSSRRPRWSLQIGRSVSSDPGSSSQRDASSGVDTLLGLALRGQAAVAARVGRTSAIYVSRKADDEPDTATPIEAAVLLCTRKSLLSLPAAQKLVNRLRQVAPGSNTQRLVALVGETKASKLAREWLEEAGIRLRMGCAVDHPVVANTATEDGTGRTRRKPARKRRQARSQRLTSEQVDPRGTVHDSPVHEYASPYVPRDPCECDSRTNASTEHAEQGSASALGSLGSFRESPFQLNAPYEPAGSQPEAIESLVEGIQGDCARGVAPRRFQTLAGITGCGKSFIAANAIARAGKPALVLAPNKILAAQLCDELRQYLPHNSVNYFVSYYSYYQPEAYLPSSDTFIEKSSSIDDNIDRLRHLATRSLVERKDVVVVASVSCIYGLGLPAEYLRSRLHIEMGSSIPGGIDGLCELMKELRYEAEDRDEHAGRAKFRVANDDSLEIGPPWEKDGTFYRVVLDKENVVQALDVVDTEGKSRIRSLHDVVLYPASHHATSRERLVAAMESIRAEKVATMRKLKNAGKVLEAQRLEERVEADLQMLDQVGFCSGVENYSMHLAGRSVGDPPDTLLDFFPADGDWTLYVDESHVTVPQLAAMHAGNLSRKEQLVRHGYRLPSAIENRPLNFAEFWAKVPQAVFMSATPGPFELKNSAHCGGPNGGVVHAVIRPTGVLDPTVEIVPSRGQVDHLVRELATVVARGERAIVTTLTKKSAEDLAEYLATCPPVRGILDRKLVVTFLHSGIDSVGRMEILEAMKSRQVVDTTPRSRSSSNASPAGEDDEIEPIDVICGVNLLREGISLPSVSLVAIMDADKEGFLRSTTALVQTMGRAARNQNGHVLLYADTITRSMALAMEETRRRRNLQIQYNTAMGQTASTVVAAGDRAQLHATASQPQADQVETLLEQVRRVALEDDHAGGSNVHRTNAVGRRSKSHAFDLMKRSSDAVKATEAEPRMKDAPSVEVLEGCSAEQLIDFMAVAIRNEDFETAAVVRDRMTSLGMRIT